MLLSYVHLAQGEPTPGSSANLTLPVYGRFAGQNEAARAADAAAWVMSAAVVLTIR